MSILSRILRKIMRDTRRGVGVFKARKQGLEFIAPNFVFWPRLSPDDIVIDVGCSYEADFSVLMIERYGARSFGVDPTRKHRNALAALEEKFLGKFIHLPVAVSSLNGELVFHESDINESGSLMDNHINVISDKIKSYSVESMTLPSLVKACGVERVSILKLDIEGAEYQLLADIKLSDLDAFDQVFVEFHHHAVSDFTISDTQSIVNRMNEFGFKSFSVDEHNYLFWRA